MMNAREARKKTDEAQRLRASRDYHKVKEVIKIGVSSGRGYAYYFDSITEETINLLTGEGYSLRSTNHPIDGIQYRIEW